MQKSILQEMIENLANTKINYAKEYKKFDGIIEGAIAETESNYLTAFCKEQEGRIVKTKEEIEIERKKINEVVEKIIKKNEEVTRVEYVNQLSKAVHLLEPHLITKREMEKELLLLKKLGEQDPIVKAIAEDLSSLPDIKNGLDEPMEIHTEYRRSINRAKFGAMLDQSEGIAGYTMRFMLYLIFKNFKFSPKHSEYIDNKE